MESKAFDEAKDLGKKFASSQDASDLFDKYSDFGYKLRTGIHKESEGDVILENENIDMASDSFDDLEKFVYKLNSSKWGDDVRELGDKLMATPEFDKVKWSYLNYLSWSNKKRPAERAAAQLKTAVNEELKITDMPTSEKGTKFLARAKEQYDSLYHDAMEDLEVEKAIKEEEEAERKKKEAAESLIEMHSLYKEVMSL